MSASRDWMSTDDVECRRCLALEHALWVRRRVPPRHQRDALDPADEVESDGSSIRLSRLLPCAVPISWTPRSAMVRAAAPQSVPISSITITWGMWFSTASIITACC